MHFSRRSFLSSAATSAALVLVPIPVSALELKPDVAEAIDAILNGREASEAGIELDAPTVAENGAQVPLTIRVNSPMTSDDHIETIHIIATANPEPGIGRFHLTPRVAKAEVFTRIRLAEEQEYLVFAELNDGRILQAAARTAVSIGGCAT